MINKELEECFIILSVIGQISIDLAKKSFDIDVVKEINRIRNLSCMKNKAIPLFFANNKKQRANKDFGDKEIASMKCPMDIMAKIIEDRVVKYAGRESHLPLNDFWNREIKGKGNKDKQEKLISAAEEYNSANKWLESNKMKLDDSTFFSLKNHAMSQFMNKVSKHLEQDTIMQLVRYATDDDNSDICTTVLNFLFRNHRDSFMNCFIKSEKNGHNFDEKHSKTA